MKTYSVILVCLLLAFSLPGCTPATAEPALDQPTLKFTPTAGATGELPTRTVAAVTSIPTRRPPRLTPTLEPSTAPTSTVFSFSSEKVLEGTWNVNEMGGLGVAVDAFVTAYGYQLVIITGGGILWYDDHEAGFGAVFASPVDVLFPNTITTRTSDYHVILAEFHRGESGEVILWEVSNSGVSSIVKKIQEPILRAGSLAFSPDGRKLVVGYNNGEVRVFNTQDGALLYRISAHVDEVTGLRVSYDNRYLATDSWSNDPFSYIFDLESGEKLATLTTEGYEPGALSFSIDGSLVSASASDGTHIFRTSDWSDTGVVIPSVWEAEFAIDSGLMMVSQGTAFTDLYSTLTGEKVATIDSAPLSCFHRYRSGGNTWELVALEVDAMRNLVTMYTHTP